MKDSADHSAYLQIYAVARAIPAGRVTSYGRLATLSGHPHWARVAGYAMRACNDGAVPCHRVLHSDGRLPAAFGVGGSALQRNLLEAEGVAFLPDGRVDMARFAWRGE